MDTVISSILQVNIEANKPTQLLNGGPEICTQAAGSQVCDVKHCALLHVLVRSWGALSS